MPRWTRKLLQKRAEEIFLTVTGLVDGRKTDVLAEARNVTIQQGGLARAIGTTNCDQAIGSFRCGGQVGHQQGVLFGMENLRRTG
jgi:hypothetical protein